MFTIEAERDGLKEQTLKKSILQGKIRLTVKKKKVGEEKKAKRETFLVKYKVKGKK